MAVVLLPQPALGGHVRATDDLEYRIGPVGGGRDLAGVETRVLDRLGPWAVVQRRIVRQWRQRNIADNFALVLQHDVARFRGPANDGGVQAPLFEDRVAFVFAAGLEDGQHPLLAFRQHHLIGGHALFALRHHV